MKADERHVRFILLQKGIWACHLEIAYHASATAVPGRPSVFVQTGLVGSIFRASSL